MELTRQNKCEIAFDLGYVYEPESGLIYGKRGFQVGYLRKTGYIGLYTPNFKHLAAHHYAWFYIYGNVDFEQLDHINRIKTDNRIINLRKSNSTENNRNREFKGYWFSEKRQKYKTTIMVDGKSIYGGEFDTESQARDKYQELKVKYHNLQKYIDNKYGKETTLQPSKV